MDRVLTLLDAKGRPIRRRLGFLRGYEPEPQERPEVSLIACSEIRTEAWETLIEARSKTAPK